MTNVERERGMYDMKAIGIVFCDERQRPIVACREIRRGGNKGKLEVKVPDGVEKRYNLRRRTLFIVKKGAVRFFS